MIADIVSQLLPIFIIIGIGTLLRVKNLLAPATMEQLKTLIINVSLPAVLFLSFFRMDLRPEMWLIATIVFVVCVLLYLFGRALAPVAGPFGAYLPFLSTGFEFGMMGAVFFGAAFGMDNMSYIAVIALGHEIFIWFVYFTLIRSKESPDSAKESLGAAVLRFLRSPIIIGIIAGLLLNVIGLERLLRGNPVGDGIVTSLEYLTGLTIPLILIVLGYGLRFRIDGLKQIALFSVLRLALVLAAAIAIDFLVFRALLDLPRLFSAALYTFVILPPPFILPLFVSPTTTAKHEQRALITNTLVFYSTLSIAVFAVFYVVFSLAG
ncbi:MAG: AEC family transporter [Spirochaetota bacterium]